MHVLGAPPAPEQKGRGLQKRFSLRFQAELKIGNLEISPSPSLLPPSLPLSLSPTSQISLQPFNSFAGFGLADRA